MTLKERDYLKNHIDIPNRRLMMVTGIWPYEESSSRSLRIRCINLTFVLIISFELRMLCTFDFTIHSLNDIMQLFVPTLSFVFIYNNACYNSTTVRFLMDAIRFKWEKTVNDEELKSMQRYFEESQFYTFIMTCFFYLYVVILLFPSFVHVVLYTTGVTNATQLITPMLTELNINDTLFCLSILLLQYVLIVVTSIVGMSYYSMLLSFVQYTCALFDITMIKLNEPFIKNPNVFNLTISNKNYEQEYDWIITVIKHYNEATEVLHLAKGICEKTLIFEVILTFALFILDIFYILQLHDFSENMSKKLKNIIYIASSFLVAFAYSHFGQKVINHTEGVFIQCCQVPFYGLSLKTQKILLMLIIKSMKPCSFSIKEEITISYEVFLAFVRITFSYATVFHKIQ